jgi:hypothetical protein
MTAQQWRYNEAGFFELVDDQTGEILERERKRKPPRRRLSDRGPGRPKKIELPSAPKNPAQPKQRLYNFTESLADEICSAVAQGALLTLIAPSLGIPYREICRARAEFPEFDRRVRLALECRALQFEEQVLAVAESLKDEKGVSAARLKVDVYKWAAARNDPARYCRKKVIDQTKEKESVQLVLSTGFSTGTIVVNQEDN